MTQETTPAAEGSNSYAASGILQNFSAELAGIVERAAPSIVRVDDGSRLTATGILWTADGIVATTSHGVERDEDITVELSDGRTLPAMLIGRDPDMDVALLRVDTTGLPAAVLASVEGGVPAGRIGELVVALARPGRTGLQASLGIISGRLDSQSGGQPESVLQTDATLYPGFSGGALIDMQGRVVGMTNLLFGRGKGIALSTAIVQNAANALLAHGRVRRGYLGIVTQAVTLPAGMVQASTLTQESGLLIMQVGAGSPAEQGGLMLGDTLLAVGEQTVQNVDDLRQGLRSHGASQAVALKLLRGGELRLLNVTLGVEN